MNRRALFLLATLCSVSLVAAQTTTRVQGNALIPAIAAAAPGDILIVSGVVTSPIEIRKPIFIHGENAVLISTVTVRGIPAQTSVVLQDLGTFALVPITVADCAGSVLVSKVNGTILATNCADLTISECDAFRTRLTNSNVALIGGSFAGGCVQRGIGTLTPGILIDGGFVSINGSRIVGGCSATYGEPAVRLLKGMAEVTGDAHLEGGQQFGRGPAQPLSVLRGATFFYDPGTVFTPALSPATLATKRPQPFLVMPASEIGTTATVTLVGQRGDAFGLFVGGPGPAVSLPGIVGRFAVAQPILVRRGTLASGRSSLSFAVPNNPLLRGVAFRWQGITVRGGVGTFSPPLTECHF